MLKAINGLPILGAIALIAWAAWSRSDLADDNMDYPSVAKVAGESCTVKAGSIYDGDTLRVVCGGEELKIRMCGIDAPETDQPGGIESRDYLRSLLPDNQPVAVVRVETDRYGRTVAEVWNDELTDTDPNINAAMVLAKQAWHYERYSGNCPNGGAIAAAEQIAGQPPGTPPWEWRKSDR